jgi:quercetin dioxygenase-like cupin family protein
MRRGTIGSGGRWQWLITGDSDADACGMVMVTELVVGESVAPHTYTNAESATFVIDGLGLWGGVRLRAGAGIHNPPGTRRAFEPETRSLLLVVYGGVDSPSTLVTDGVANDVSDGAVFGDLATAPAGAVPGSADMNIRWLATRDTVGASALVLATSVFEAGGAHELHRHPHAGEYFIVLDGGGDHLTPAGRVHLAPGDYVYVAPGEWHGFRTDEGVLTRAVYGYLGVGTLGEAGYELSEASTHR